MLPSVSVKNASSRELLRAESSATVVCARSNSLEEAFFVLTEGSAEYSASNLAYQGSI